MDAIKELENVKLGSVLVCGAGIAGIQASLDLAGSGFKVYLLDSAAAIGGRIAELDRTLSNGDCAVCVLSPKLVECARNRNIDILTLSDVQHVSGQPGRYKVRIRKNPRYVDIKKCDACGDCAEVCPVDVTELAGGESRKHKAIFKPYPQAIPNVFTISKTGQAPCKNSCPAGINVQGVLALIAAGQFGEACELILRRSPLPSSCGRVCREFCRDGCSRETLDSGISMGSLERFVAEFVYANPEHYPVSRSSSTLSNGRVAVVGGGPAGLTASADLARMGYRVTLFEAQPELGGMLRYGIPGYRLPKDVLAKEIQLIVDLGIEIKTNSPIIRPKDLLKSGDDTPDFARQFDAVFIATGAWKGRKLGIPGESSEGIWGALDFLYSVNTGKAPKIGPDILVIGGSDIAIDAARCAMRLPGVESVHLACLENRQEMTASPDQTEQASDEGVIFHNGLGPTRMQSRSGRVTGAVFRACTSVFDRYRGFKRYNPLFDDSQISSINADTVIVALEAAVDSRQLGMELRPGGRILTNERTLATSIKGIFAGGDAVLGAGSVVDAIAQGHRAAESISAYIRSGSNIRSADIIPFPAGGSMDADAAGRASKLNKRALRRPHSTLSRGPQGMSEVHMVFTREQAVAEAQRCLNCGQCSECMRCVQTCAAGAILHAEQPTEIEIEVGGIIFASGTTHTAERLGLEPCPGIYMAGGMQESDIRKSVIEGSAAAAGIMGQLSSVRGTLIQRDEFPWERDVADESPRIGVFICHCGHNISSVVEVEEIARRVAQLPGVCRAETCIYTCSEASQIHIREMIRQYRLNRLVVASCSSRTHEVLFQETLRESGLNQYLFAMANIRDQCSWVHKDDPAQATEKAMDLVSMAIARARCLKQLPLYELPVVPSALILGGGVAGMTAALSIAAQGYSVHLVERSVCLGGMLRKVRGTMECGEVDDRLKDLEYRVRSDPRITVHTGSELVRTYGQVGNFRSTLNVGGNEVQIEHGTVVVATGGQQTPTDQYLHGKNPRVVTQSRLESMLHGDNALSEFQGNKSPMVVMIQCVESRDEKHPYCSRICCENALVNAMEIRQRLPHSKLIIIGGSGKRYAELRVRYEEALAKGVQFISNEENCKPSVEERNGQLEVKFRQASNGRNYLLTPDLLVLSTGISPADGNPALARILRSTLSSDGFFLEANPRLRPVELANEGEFLCGLAHSPGLIKDTIKQAQAVAARVATILSKPQLEIMGQIAFVHPAECVACATCVKVCPYGAPMINELKKAEIQTAKCMGCGSCTSACPAKAVMLQHHEGETMAAMFDQLLAGGSL